MASQIVPISINAPGFFGLNTQDSPTDMDQRYALDATNCVIDRSGRVASRKGWLAQHTTYAPLGSANIETMGELVGTSGVSTIIVAGNNKIFKFTGTALSELTYGGGGVAPTITASNWQYCSLGNTLLLFQTGHDPLVYDTTLSTTQYRRLSESPSYAATVPLANCVISAYGRVWAASSAADKTTISWSDTGTYQWWTGGTAGSLNLTNVWPAGGDEIVALAAHNNSLIIFGRRQTLVYVGAINPTTMTLGDTITGIGCVSRDSVQMTGEDVIFLSDSGLRSLARTIQEKSAPVRTISRNVNDDIQGYIGENSTVDVQSVYSPHDSFYLLSFRSSGMTYCFDLRTLLQDGSSRVTTWYGMAARSYLYTAGRELLIGKAGYVGKYDGYTDNGSPYRMSYLTTWIDFGVAFRTSILKKIRAIVSGAQNQSVIFKWGFDYSPSFGSDTVALGASGVSEYALAEYGTDEYNTNLTRDRVQINTSGTGKVVQVGIEATPTTYVLSLQSLDILTKEGRI